MTSRKNSRTVNRKPAVSSKTKRSGQMSLVQKWKGVPVCIVLKDGSVYVGTITGVDDKTVSVAGIKGSEKLKRSAPGEQQVHVSGLLDLFFGKSPAAAVAAPAGSSGVISAGGGAAASPLGFLGGLIPNIRLGIGMLKQIMPLLGAFKG